MLVLGAYQLGSLDLFAALQFYEYRVAFRIFRQLILEPFTLVSTYNRIDYTIK